MPSGPAARSLCREPSSGNGARRRHSESETSTLNLLDDGTSTASLGSTTLVASQLSLALGFAFVGQISPMSELVSLDIFEFPAGRSNCIELFASAAAMSSPS